MEMTKRMAKRLGVPPTRAGFLTVPVARTVAETMRFALSFVRNPLRNGSSSFMLSPFRVLSGTPSMPDPPLVAARADAGVPLLAGTTRNEAFDFLKLFGDKGLPGPLAWYAERVMNADGSIKRAYREGRGVTGGVPLLDAVWTDWAFRIPTIRLLEARRAVSHLYEFRWQNPSHPPGLGAPHSIEMPFMRDDLAGALAMGGSDESWVGQNPPQALATEVHDVWVRFAKTGDPGWSPYEDGNRTTMLFDNESRVVDDAASPERQAWAGRR
jgi:carboxylesterase type B